MQLFKLRSIILLKLVFIAWLIFQSASAFSQTLPPGSMEAAVIYLPRTGYWDTADSLKNPNSSEHTRISLGYSFLICSKLDTVTKRFSSWSSSIHVDYSTFKNTTNVDQLIPSKLLFSEWGLTHIKTMGNNWTALQGLSLGLNSDLKEVTYHDLFVNANVLFIKKYGPGFSLGFGVVAYNAINTPIVLPGIFVQWQTSGSYRLLINLPTEVSIAYDVNKSTELKVAFRPRNYNYDVQNPLAKDRRSLSYWELPIGLELKKKTKKLDYGLSGGIMPLRSFQYNRRGISNMFKSSPAHMLKSQFFVNATIQYHF